jgi:hypothetical protein
MVWINFPVNIFADQKEVQSDKALDDLKSSHPTELISKELDRKELKNFWENKRSPASLI